MGKGAFWIIAGPNGVGKTTYAFGNLRQTAGTVRFVNLDEIARGLSPLEPALAERDAARIAIDRAHAFIADGVTFAMETTLSGRTHFHLAEEARAAGLDVNLHYFSVADPQICLERIARRVAMGGHDVPADVVARRLERSVDNVHAFTRLCTLWRIFDSSTLPPKLAAEGKGAETVFVDPSIRDRLHGTLRSWI
ncbi:conserved hypothetical protein [uncultured Pleomorphomonas sp.]|uniref:UDP-N-acetylglucosamine kinase n=1 Tax=uncultured Pleomorphomonas sp. TaxID=442121 RepID=A0A212L1E7_9HYPH|nr:AAA family ATPase [uncultured Pleomorphomonas sp.]SCM71394.1 conserved hypothetical protein [uncultured Pleomorphomonas sp.]